MNTQKTIEYHTAEACRKAYAYSQQGEGASTIGVYLGVTTRQADAMIDAGRELATQVAPGSHDTCSDSLAESLPQSESVQAHYAAERVRDAAPELLAALQAVEAAQRSGEYESAFATVREAIAKATK